MASTKMKDIRAMSDEEISTAIADTKRELFDLRFKKATRQLETGFHQFKQNKKKLAQLMTIERERQIASESSGATTTSETTEA